MKIAYVGNFSQPHCTEVHIAATLEDLGHDVHRLQENAYTPEQLQAELTQMDKLDLFLFTRTWGETVNLGHLVWLMDRAIPTASYHLDLYVGLERKYLHQGKSLDEVLQTDPFWRTDFVFTPDGDPRSGNIFFQNGVNHYYMKPGVYKPECYMATPNQDATGTVRPIDVMFVGGGDRPGSPNGYGHPEWPYRDKLIGWLYETYGARFTKFGYPQTTVRNKELNQLYANSKVVIGDSVCIDFDHEYYWSDRVYETMGRGGFLIHPYIKGLEEEFTDGENIVFYNYNDFDQLKDLIDYYLTHDQERENIRYRGHTFVQHHATYHDRLTQALGIINAN